MIGIGIAVGLVVDAHEADRTGFGREVVYSLATWLIIFGIIGGRLYYVVQNDLGYYLTHPQDILATWQGGMAFYGTIFVCFVVILVFAYRRQLSFWRLLDTLVLGLPLGQCFGRIGNMINGDIVGYPTSSPFAFVYTNPQSFIDPAYLNRPVFPAALVEFFASLLIFGLLWVLRTRLRTPGLLTVVYLLAYSISQFIVFFWRANSITLFGLKQAQLTAIFVIAACLPLAIYLVQRHRSQGETAEQPPTTAVPQEEGLASGAAEQQEHVRDAT
jgi:phosphatidylglycerol:prolipoprotein diacylglycerol transferase